MIRLVEWVRFQLALRASVRRRAVYDRGYAWAAGQMVSGVMTPDEVLVKADDPWDYSGNPFDAGVMRATVDFTRLTRDRT